MILTEPYIINLPWPGKPKPRPRVTTNERGESHTYNPAEYTEWKQNIVELLAHHKVAVEGKCKLEILFTEKDVHVRVIPITYEFERDKHVTADLDNLCGGVMDALENAGVLENDRDVVALNAQIRNRHE